MNLIRKCIVVICFIFYSLISCAQQIELSPSQELTLQQRSIKNASFIFEGLVINQEDYLNKKGSMLTNSLIQITKIFKGSGKMKLGSINVITEQGGRVGNYIQDIQDGPTGIYPGITYIIIGNSSDTSILPKKSFATDNSFSVSKYDLIILNDLKNRKRFPPGTPAARWSWGNTAFKTVDELYTYLKEKASLTLQEQVKQPLVLKEEQSSIPTPTLTPDQLKAADSIKQEQKKLLYEQRKKNYDVYMEQQIKMRNEQQKKKQGNQPQ